MRLLLVTALVLGGCWSRVRDEDGGAFTVRRTLVSRCHTLAGDERILAQVISRGSGGCIEDLFSDDVLGAAECESFERRVADSDCTSPGRPIARHVVNLSFGVGPGEDLPAARLRSGRWFTCDEGTLTERALDGVAWFTPRDPPQLVLGDARLHGVVRPTLCSDVQGRFVEVPDTDVLDTGFDTAVPWPGQ